VVWWCGVGPTVAEIPSHEAQQQTPYSCGCPLHSTPQHTTPHHHTTPHLSYSPPPFFTSPLYPPSSHTHSFTHHPPLYTPTVLLHPLSCCTIYPAAPTILLHPLSYCTIYPDTPSILLQVSRLCGDWHCRYGHRYCSG
jgi:hypothetical protein